MKTFIRGILMAAWVFWVVVNHPKHRATLTLWREGEGRRFAGCVGPRNGYGWFWVGSPTRSLSDDNEGVVEA